jgi:hypothetical protein
LAGPDETPLATLLILFWGAFAAAVAAAHILNPLVFARTDPDALMRLVEVRDLIGGQAWFDLVQHRLDPPAGVLMHWSRLIDAPIAGLVFLGDALFGGGEAFALVVWPLSLLLAAMAGSLLTATALLGRPAALPALILPLVFFDPLVAFLPGSIDHHNAQIALTLLAAASALRARAHPGWGLAAGLLSALMLAIGLETLALAAVIGAWLALAWAFGWLGAKSAAVYGAALAAAAPALVLAAGSPDARMACDVLSFAYVPALAAAGGGLAVLAPICRNSSASVRLAGLGALALAASAALLAIAPECLGGPYAALSAEMRALFLARVSEAQPLLTVLRKDPAGTLAGLAPALVALAVALRHSRGFAALWTLPAATIAVALGASLFQVRSLPFADALAIPALAAWLAALAADRGWRTLRVAAATLATLPLTWLALGWLGAAAAGAFSAEPLKPLRAGASDDAVLTQPQRDCLDQSSAALLRKVPRGLVIAPVFYGPSVLVLSRHSVVAGPYHRAAAAVLDSFDAFALPPDRAGEILAARNVDYLAYCTTALETGHAIAEAPGGLLAGLVAGESIPWLQPVAPAEPTMLRLYRVVR